jgi:hypothetical protein
MSSAPTPDRPIGDHTVWPASTATATMSAAATRDRRDPPGQPERGVDEHGRGDVADVAADDGPAGPGVHEAREAEEERGQGEPGEASGHGDATPGAGM